MNDHQSRPCGRPSQPGPRNQGARPARGQVTGSRNQGAARARPGNQEPGPGTGTGPRYLADNNHQKEVRHISSKEDFRLPDELARKLKAEATRKHSTKTAVAIEALEYYFGKPDLVMIMAAFLASTELLAMAKKQDAKELRKVFVTQARSFLEADKNDFHKAGQRQQKNHEGS